MKDLDVKLTITGSPVSALSSVLTMAKALNDTMFVTIKEANNKVMAVSPDSNLNDLANIASLEIKVVGLTPSK